MSKKLKVRTLQLEKLPYGLYSWIVVLKQPSNNINYAFPNEEMVKPLIELLENSSSSKRWKFEYHLYNSRKVYTKILLTNAMDVALIKLCHAETIGKIYQIQLRTS
jgi:hypothetical protein